VSARTPSASLHRNGVGASRARTLAAAGFTTPAEVVAAGADRLAAAGLSDGVADRVVESARELPAVDVEWGPLPDSVAPGNRELHEVTVRSTAGSARAGVRVTVNGHEMTSKGCYLGTTTVPVAVFGGDVAELTIAVEVVFPDLPLSPTCEARTVRVE
jgi:hypothetical protein